MKGDFSRDSYQAGSQYSRVMMQQGRVLLDADWNEQTAILLGYMRALTRDLFGPAAGPAGACGFQIVSAESRGSLPAELAAQVDAILKADKADLGDDDLLILPGRYYVGGLPVEIADPIRYRAQTGFPFGDTPPDSLRQRDWIAYLDVWEDYVAADQDPFIRDVTLGGIDTCGRARIRWQVRLLLDVGDQSVFDALAATGSGRLRARANPSETSDDLCTIAPDARYRGAENQLYRVEIHTGGDAEPKGSGATFKWSRDNGAILFPVLSASGNSVALAHLGRDQATTLVEGDWVELVDDATGAAGLLARVATVERDDLRVTLSLADGAPSLPTYAAADAVARHALLRRWDHPGDPSRAGGAIPVVEGEELELEDGVKITFEPGGTYRAGEYWMIPARVLTGEVEWPGLPDTPKYQHPHGPAHYYAPLAGRGSKATGAAEFTDLRCCIRHLPCGTPYTVGGSAAPTYGTEGVTVATPVKAGVPKKR